MFAFLLRRWHVFVTFLAVRHHRLSVIWQILRYVDTAQYFVEVNIDYFDCTLRTSLAKGLLKLYEHITQQSESIKVYVFEHHL